jgi:hypothetical protein
MFFLFPLGSPVLLGCWRAAPQFPPAWDSIPPSRDESPGRAYPQ